MRSAHDFSDSQESISTTRLPAIDVTLDGRIDEVHNETVQILATEAAAWIMAMDQRHGRAVNAPTASKSSTE